MTHTERMPITLSTEELEAQATKHAVLLGSAELGTAVLWLEQAVEALRLQSSPDALRVLQHDLIADLEQLENQRAELRRFLRKQRRSVDESHASGADLRADPTLARLFGLRRTIWAMRRFGDSIALRLLNFDRFYMQVVGIGQHPGEMLAKSGTTAEIARFEAEWDRGRPAILHAVTTCLRIGDVSVRTADGWEPIEVKMSESARVRGNQRRNLRLALATLRPGSEPTKVEPAERFPFTTPVTHWLSTLGDVLAAAAKDGVASARLEDYSNVLALDLRALGDGRSREEGGSAIEAAWDRVALAVPPSAIAVRGWSAEKQRLSQFGMPFTSYPFPEPVCAALAAGYLSFTVVLDLQQIASRIRRAGFGCEVILSETEERWFRVSRGNDTITVPESLGERMLYEAMHPDCLIGALRELAAAGDSDEPHAKEIVPTFRDEGAIWA